MGSREVINDTLVNLFNEILKLEEDVLVTGEFHNISVNDFHVINAEIQLNQISRNEQEYHLWHSLRSLLLPGIYLPVSAVSPPV